MENCKLLNLKNMKETIVNYSGDQKEFDKIWDAFYQMACIGFISQDTWIKFFDQCAGGMLMRKTLVSVMNETVLKALMPSSGSMCRMPNTRHEQHSRSGGSGP